MPEYRYAGPESRIPRSQAANLGRRWRLQPKIDGCYAEVTTDAHGRIARIRSRTGRLYTTPAARSLLGCQILPGYGVVVGEMEDHTPVGVRAARERGYACVHLFDALMLDDLRPLADLPYSERQAALYRAWVANADANPDELPERGRDGRYARPIPRGWRRAPILEDWPVSHLGRLWDELVEPGRAEGLVAVAMEAPLGAHRAKRKCKPYDSIDCIVREVLPGKLVVRSFCGTFTVQWSGRHRMRRGQVVAIRHDGVYPTGVPRFPRVDRVRNDLAA